jgi:hypothetical protein
MWPSERCCNPCPCGVWISGNFGLGQAASSANAGWIRYKTCRRRRAKGGGRAWLQAAYGNAHIRGAMSRWWARRLGTLAVVLALAPFSGAQAREVLLLVVPFPPFFSATPPQPRIIYEPAQPAYVPRATELVPPPPPPPGRCYTPTTICPLSDQRLVGHPCSCLSQIGHVEGRGLIPPSVRHTAASGS